MMRYVVAYLAAGTTLFAVDVVWLGIVAKSFYREQIGSLMLDEINIVAAILFYAVVGVVIFAVSPALRHYDMTNLATLRGWPIAMVVVEIAWGTFLTAISATVAFLVTQRLFPASGAA